MNATLAANRIAMMESTIANHSDVLSPGQLAGMRATIATLKAKLEGTVTEMPKRTPKPKPAPELPASELTPEPAIDLSTVPRNPLTAEFVLAGKAFFTFTSPSGNHLTFRVEKPEQKFYGEYFASVMKGSDNETSYAYVGMVHENTLKLRETKGSKFRSHTPEFKALALALALIRGEHGGVAALPPGAKLQHAEKCGRCGLKLTTPESIATGFGPECAHKLGIKRSAA